jgi:peroxiredoxin
MVNRSFFAGMFAGVILIAAIGVIGLAGAMLLPRSYLARLAASGLRPPPLPFARADFGWNLTSIDGKSTTLESMKGKAIVVTVFQPDCGMCQTELPSLQNLYARLDQAKTAFFLVAPIPSVAAKSPNAFLDNVRTMIRDNQLAVPLYTCASPLPEVFHVQSTPATIVIAPDGEIVLKHIGAAKWDDESVVRFIESLTLATLEQAPKVL